ncbi:MAG: filamentous hemagglutinin N-terminal domain-containing protein, partial [Gammaproteobacteria bacterium]|nr:filamentous hemagglutinin N-terminal domain-containing protein [Gammaproteobacteria bacterium]
MDGTLGQAGSLAGPDYLIGAEIGQQHGVNLFHSFGEFNIYQGESATFTGPDSISNVISRVTGGRSSEIDGILRNAISGADLYFINPSGVLFGPNAALDVDGSIYVSTADTLRFTDGGEFNARDPEVSVLSIAPAKAFGFSDGSAGKLDIHNAAIQVKEKETLSLIGKGVRIESATLTLPSGHLNLVSAASTGDIMLDNEGLNTGSSGKFGDIQVVDSAVNASGEGNVYIRGGRFELMNTRINARTETHEAGGGVDIKAAEVIIHDSVIDSSTSGTGRAGDISIESGGETVLSGGSRIYAVTEESANAGNAANIRIKAGKLRMTDASAVLGMTFGNGEGGEITVHVDESAMLTDSDISAQSKSGAQGNAGDVLLTAGQLALMDGGTVTSTAFGSADSGSVTVKVSGPLEVTGVTPDERFTSRIGANTYEEGGNAGDVWVEAESVTVKNGGTITSLTWGAGNGANISIKAEDSVTITGIAGKHRSGIGVDSFGDSEDAGNAGIISIETGKLEINRRGRLTSRTFGSGKGGDIIVKARGPIAIFGGESVSGIA